MQAKGKSRRGSFHAAMTDVPGLHLQVAKQEKQHT